MWWSGVRTAAIGLAMIAGVASHADFTGLEVEHTENVSIGFDTDLAVFRIYATFSTPTDQVLLVGGSSIVTDAAGGFWKAPAAAGWTAPSAAVVNLFPETAYDSFVTIGLGVDDGTDSTALDPDWATGPGWVSGGWFNANPGNPNGQMFPDGDGRVLLMQLTVDASTGSKTAGEMLLFWKPEGPGGATFEALAFEFEVIPTPGVVMAVLAGGLLAGRRRRRA